MSVKIRFKKLLHGNQSIFLDIHFKGKRWSEFLDLKVREKPSNPLERNQRKNSLEIALQIANKRELELISNRHNVLFVQNKTVDFIAYAKSFIELNKETIQIRSYTAALNWLIKFVGKEYLYCHEINEPFIQRYATYLEGNLTGLTPHTYFKKIRMILKAAKADKILIYDFSYPIRIKQNTNGEKDVLTFEDLKALINTRCGNSQVKNAFLLANLTGLRYCDLVALKWKHVKGDKIQINQQKTKEPIKVVINTDAKHFLGVPKPPNEPIFKLPSHTACLKNIKLWVKNAGIDKHVTMHVGRHSFGTNLFEVGVDIYSISKMLGHKSVKYTSIYTRYSDKMEQAAMQKIPQLLNIKNETNDTEK